ncbi:hypothetical protein AAMO2058_000842000 [Amorphochlora amoebiformis]
MEALIDEKVQEANSQPRHPIVRMFEFLNPRGDDKIDSWEERVGLVFEDCILILIAINVVTFALSTVPVLEESEKAQESFFIVECFSVTVFTIELIFRIWSAPGPHIEKKIEDPTYQPRLGYVFSFYGLVDMAAVVPFYVDLCLPNASWKSTAIVRVFRLARMLRGPQAVEAQNMLHQVVIEKRNILMVTLYAACTLWIVFAVLLYLTEGDDYDNESNGIPMAHRYGTIPNSMWYTLIHLTGDFPLVDYTWQGKLVLCVMVLMAVAVVCLPAGIYAEAFQNLMERRAKAIETEEKNALASEREGKKNNIIAVSDNSPLLDVKNNGSKGYSSLSDGKDQKAKEMTQIASNAATSTKTKDVHAPLAYPHHSLNSDSLRARAYEFVFAITPAGQWFEVMILSLIAIATVSFILSTVDELNTEGGVMFFYTIEVVCVIVFTIEYGLRFWSCVEVPDQKNSPMPEWRVRIKYFFSLLSIIDLCSILPFYVDALMGPGRQLENTSAIRGLRLFRIFLAEKYVAAFSLFGRVWSDNKYILMYTGGAFDSVPNSLFMTAIFMGGEWARSDFTPAGKVLGIAMCWIIINLFAVPIGIIASGFEQVTTQARKEAMAREKERRAKS